MISLEARRPSVGIAEFDNRVAFPPPSMTALQADENVGEEPRVDADHLLPIAISDAFVAEILKPYRSNAKYLKSAEITQFSEEANYDSTSKVSLVTGAGRFSMPASANHVASFAEYKKHQLPAMLIVRVDGVRFFKPMKSDDFRAELSIDRMTMLGQAGFFYTTITFSDCEGVKAKGCVVLACQPNLTR
jgi:hypothetical protein